jgi:hypothetical protein
MASRCMNCNGILMKTDKVCYSCGDKAPKWVSTVPRVTERSRGATIVNRLVFCASISLTAYSFLAENKPPLDVSLAASGALIAMKLIVDWTSRLRSNRG